MSLLRWLRSVLAVLGDALRGPCPRCAELRKALAKVEGELDYGAGELARAWDDRSQAKRGAELAIAAVEMLKAQLAECRGHLADSRAETARLTDLLEGEPDDGPRDV